VKKKDTEAEQQPSKAANNAKFQQLLKQVLSAGVTS
jgi:hypothetical protein